MRKGPDGALYFVDRKKNIVRRSGENIAVVEVEGVLQNLDEVAGVAVAPVPDDIRGEEVFALVKLHAGVPDLTDAPAKAEQIARACAEQLAYHKVPGYFAFVEHLPTTATQKLQRAEIRRLAAICPAEPGNRRPSEPEGSAPPCEIRLSTSWHLHAHAMKAL